MIGIYRVVRYVGLRRGVGRSPWISVHRFVCEDRLRDRSYAIESILAVLDERALTTSSTRENDNLFGCYFIGKSWAYINADFSLLG